MHTTTQYLCTWSRMIDVNGHEIVVCAYAVADSQMKKKEKKSACNEVLKCCARSIIILCCVAHCRDIHSSAVVNHS